MRPAGPGVVGLRRAQAGAAWAVSAAFTSGRPNAALAVLPTGTGKTTVLALIPLLSPPDRPVLVVVPNKVIKRQVAAAFTGQRGIIDAAVLPEGVDLPKLNTRISDRAEVIFGNASILRTLLTRWATTPPGTSFEVSIVQPGLDIDQVNGWEAGERLLEACRGDLLARDVAFHLIGGQHSTELTAAPE